jgi:hypothetical protein
MFFRSMPVVIEGAVYCAFWGQYLARQVIDASENIKKKASKSERLNEKEYFSGTISKSFNYLEEVLNP